MLLKREKERLAHVSALVELLELTRKMVENYSMSASEILFSCGSELLERCGYNGIDAPKSFMDMSEHCDIYDDSARAALGEFAADFGKNYRERQIEKCSSSIEKLRSIKEKICEQLPARQKLIVCGCASLTIIVIILLL